MRFDSLRLPRYGHFTDLRLDFPAAGTDFHLLYGPNEAGKSTLLRGICDLLYEIPRQSSDNFIHKHADLRLAADLRSRDGRTLTIQRVKKNKQTLLDAEGSPLPDDTLQTWLGLVGREHFTTMFGLASDDLVRGGKEMLEGKGDLGKALFSASLGGTPVHKILEALKLEARTLYAGNGRARLRQSRDAHAEEVRQARAHLTRAEDWETAGQELADARKSQAEIEQQQAAVRNRIDWLQRCLDALPTLGRWQAKMEELAAMTAVPQVPPGFVADVRATIQGSRQNSLELHQREDEIARLAIELAACQPRTEVLEREAEIESLHQALGAHRDLCKRLSARQAELALLEPGLRADMRDLALDGDVGSLETRRLSAPEFATVKELSSGLATLMRKQEAANTALRDRDMAVGQLRSKLAQLAARDVSKVREALTLSSDAVEARRTLDAVEADCAKAGREVQSQHRLLRGAPSDLAATDALAMPLKAATAALQGARETLLRAAGDAAKDHTEAVKKRDKLQRELDSLQAGGRLPSADDLTSARGQRQDVWLRLVNVLGDAKAGTVFAREHEQAQQRADDLADALHEHAEDAAKAAHLRTSITEAEQNVSAAALRMQEAARTQAEWQGSWCALWQAAGLEPGTPEEMAEWREEWLEFRRRFEFWQSLLADVAKRKAAIAEGGKCLAEALGREASRPFMVLLDEARRLIMEADKDEGARAALTQQLADAVAQHDQAEKEHAVLTKALIATTEAWQARCRDLHLGADLNPEAGLALIEQRRALVARFDHWKLTGTEASQMQMDVRTFEGHASALAHDFKLEPGSTETLVAALWRLLGEARDVAYKHRSITGQLETAKVKLHDQRLAVEAAEASLAVLCQLAQVADEAALEASLPSIETQERLQAECRQLREALHGPARGEALDTFIDRVKAENRDTLAGDKKALEDELAALTARRDTVLEQALEAAQRKALLERAGDAAAEHRQKAESHAAALRTDAARYVRLRLATHFLEQQIERFRAENQGPLLTRASTLFQAMTRGRFEGLTAEFADDDSQVLMGRRGGRLVPVEGMSEGSRDQLYLSLRFAAIERHIENHEPLPLILDDLLMTFDDGRTMAILPLLVELSKKTQVLLFTHHEHLIELCRKALGAGEFVVHRL